jgi:hypothetical protein
MNNGTFKTSVVLDHRALVCLPVLAVTVAVPIIFQLLAQEMQARAPALVDFRCTDVVLTLYEI